jgi:hypothetical protein
MAEIYGSETHFETGRDKLKALLDALVTAMVSGYDPMLSYAYDGHGTIPILLNGVSVDLDSATRLDDPGERRGIIFQYMMHYTIRVHTNYNNRYNDRIKNARLLQSVDNYISANVNLGDNYRIHDIDDYKTKEEFPESGTVGGELTVVVWAAIEHIQS